MNEEVRTVLYRRLLELLGDYLSAVGYSRNTQRQILRGAQEFVVRIEEQSIQTLEEITVQTIVEHREYLQRRPNKLRGGVLSAMMIMHYMYSLRVFFNWLEASGELPVNPMSGLYFARPEHAKRQRATVEEIGQMYEACADERERAILSVLYGCGLREAEARALDVEDIRYNDGLLLVRCGKGGKSRRVPLSHRVAFELQQYQRTERRLLLRENRQQTPAFLLHNNGGRMGTCTLRRLLRKLIARTENDELIAKNITPHCLRHSIATHLLEAGVHIEQVQAFLGHKNIDSTQVYAQVTSEHLRRRV